MKQTRTKALLTLLVPIVVIAVAGIIVRRPPVREPESEAVRSVSPASPAPPTEPPILDRRGIAELWCRLAALDQGGRQGSLQLARRLVPSGYDQIVRPVYVRFAQSEGISRSFLADTFNRYDHMYWQDAYFFHDLAAALTRNEKDPVATLVNAVHDHLEAREKSAPKDRAPRPREVWERGWGVCDRQSWVLAEMLYQLGYETQLVYLYNEDGSSPHTIVEIRRGQQVWLADPLSNKLVPRSVERLAADEQALQELWPDKPKWQRALARSILYTPSYPQDYCWRNQELARRLKALLPTSDLPRFGEDPRERQQRFLALRKAELGADLRCNMLTWGFPFRPLLEDIRNRAERGAEKP